MFVSEFTFVPGVSWFVDQWDYFVFALTVSVTIFFNGFVNISAFIICSIKFNSQPLKWVHLGS